ncbi:hypothetical protein VaNZ11_002443 [Volvox africanus]|uniref:Uncharacterized protein n=1 Tax=Volvox africanus TaxID=51714 RepID=A0ABQ5RS86_9CHLO|nr:hypothetical protein VaNZ11_002443 [Volvox africanus]
MFSVTWRTHQNQSPKPDCDFFRRSKCEAVQDMTPRWGTFGTWMWGTGKCGKTSEARRSHVHNVDSLVSQLGPHLAPLPADAKACLLCVARRRGVLRNRVLLALADEGWTLMDLAGATALTERALRQALLWSPHLRALDISGLRGTGRFHRRTKGGEAAYRGKVSASIQGAGRPASCQGG